MYLSKNFTLEELTRSNTAHRLGIMNEPVGDALVNLRRLATELLQPVREAWGRPIIVSSGYRCDALNRAVGGVKNSDHIYGCAADLHTLSNNKLENRELYDLIVHLYARGELPELKQCIDEHHYSWLHIAYQDGRNPKRGEFIHLN